MKCVKLETMIKIKKEYSNGVLTVVYEPDLCIHSGVCSKGLPEVFQPGTRPWVKADGSTNEKIIKQVLKCPSRALSFYMNCPDSEKKKSGPMKALETGHKVEVFTDGPIMMEGPITIIGSDGHREVIEDTCYFCRCGASKSKPFCDGSHKDIGFKE